LSDLRGDVDSASEAFRKATGAVDALTERQAATRERLDELVARREQLEHRLAALERVLDERRRETAAVDERLTVVQAERARAEAAVNERETATRAVRAELETWQRELESRRETALGRLAELTECRNARADADAERAALTASRQKLTERFEHLKSELEEHGRAQGELFAGARDLDASLQRAQVIVQQRQAARGQASSRQQEMASALRIARDELTGLQSRHEALRELVERHEGVAPGARLLLESGLPGIEGLLADDLHVPQSLALAVEAALGASAQALVVSGRAEAEQALRWLTEQGGGRVRLLPRDGLAVRPGAADGALLLDRIRVEVRSESVARAVLGHVRIVDDLAECRADGVTVWVTETGDLLDEHGVLHTGRGGEEGGLVTRRAECEALAAESARLVETVAGLKDARRVETERERTRERERHAAERQTLLERDSRIVEEELSRLQGELTTVAARHEEAAKREAELQAAVSEDQAADDRHDRAREDLDDPPSARPGGPGAWRGGAAHPPRVRGAAHAERCLAGRAGRRRGAGPGAGRGARPVRRRARRGAVLHRGLQ
jgi:chromosome segregation protein